jgi:FixJ family two-component response regulator
LTTVPVISIIDDDASVRAATDNLLQSLGYAVHTFDSAEGFMRSDHLNDTSCVIADVHMPALSGVELLVLLRNRGCRVPFVFITAFPDKEIRARALSAGATGFLTKPFEKASLIQCLERALQQRDGENPCC